MVVTFGLRFVAGLPATVVVPRLVRVGLRAVVALPAAGEAPRSVVRCAARGLPAPADSPRTGAGDLRVVDGLPPLPVRLPESAEVPLEGAGNLRALASLPPLPAGSPGAAVGAPRCGFDDLFAGAGLSGAPPGLRALRDGSSGQERARPSRPVTGPAAPAPPRSRSDRRPGRGLAERLSKPALIGRSASVPG